MRGIETTKEEISNRVRAVFQHPSSYVTVLQKEDNFVYLYDEKVMAEVGVSNNPFGDTIKLIAFGRNFEVFYAYFDDAKLNKTSQSSPYMVTFKLNQRSKLENTRQSFTKNHVRIKPMYQCIASLEINIEVVNEEEVLVCLDENTCSFVTLCGKVIKEVPLVVQGRAIKAIKSLLVKNDKFIIAEQTNLLHAKIAFDQLILKEELRFQEKIANIFPDSSVSKRYVGVQTQDQKLHIVSISIGRYKISYTLVIPAFAISNLIFFYPGVNTSATNKFKDRIYAIFQGVSAAKRVDKQSKRINESGNVSFSSNTRNIFVYEFRETYINQDREILKLKLMNQLFLPDIGIARTLLYNQHEYNCIRMLNQENEFLSFSLVSVFEDAKVDEEWIYLCYKFEHCRLDMSIPYEDKQSEFQKATYMHQQKEIGLAELDDWSLSCFTMEELQNLKKNRARSLMFN